MSEIPSLGDKIASGNQLFTDVLGKEILLTTSASQQKNSVVVNFIICSRTSTGPQAIKKFDARCTRCKTAKKCIKSRGTGLWFRNRHKELQSFGKDR